MRSIVVLAGGLLLAGCAGIGGPDQIRLPLTAAQKSQVARDRRRSPDAPPVRLEQSGAALLNARFQAATRNAMDVEPDATDAASRIANFENAGFTLIKANCGDYFRKAGNGQSAARIARDTAAPLVAIATGVIALHDFTGHPNRKDHLLQILTLASGATTATLDIYQNEFLFGAENIDSVRALVMRALDAHSDTVLTQLKLTRFDLALIQLLDNQNICTPPHILWLTKAAIKNGDVQAYVSTGSPLPTLQDQTALMAVAVALGLPQDIVSLDQATALYQVTHGALTPDQYAALYPTLAPLGDKNPIKYTPAQPKQEAAQGKPAVDAVPASYAYTAGWAPAQAVRTALNLLSPNTLSGIAKLPVPDHASPAVTPSGLGVSHALGPVPAVAGTPHVEVDIGRN